MATLSPAPRLSTNASIAVKSGRKSTQRWRLNTLHLYYVLQHLQLYSVLQHLQFYHVLQQLHLYHAYCIYNYTMFYSIYIYTGFHNIYVYAMVTTFTFIYCCMLIQL